MANIPETDRLLMGFNWLENFDPFGASFSAGFGDFVGFRAPA